MPVVSYFTSCGKLSSLEKGQLGRCHYYLQYDFIATCSASFIENRESWKRQSFYLLLKVTIRLFKKIYWVIFVTHTVEAQSEPSQTSKMEPFAKIINIFRKCCIIALWLGSKYVCLESSNVLSLITWLRFLKNRMKKRWKERRF